MYCNNTHQEEMDFFFFLFGLISAYVNLFCVYRLNNSRMESVTIILLRCECVNIGGPFFCQIHFLVPGGRNPACLLAFLVLKDWNISPDFALECAMCAVLQTWAFQTCAHVHWGIRLYVLRCNNLLYMARSRYSWFLFKSAATFLFI